MERKIKVKIGKWNILSQENVPPLGRLVLVENESGSATLARLVFVSIDPSPASYVWKDVRNETIKEITRWANVKFVYGFKMPHVTNTTGTKGEW